MLKKTKQHKNSRLKKREKKKEKEKVVVLLGITTKTSTN